MNTKRMRRGRRSRERDVHQGRQTATSESERVTAKNDAAERLQRLQLVPLKFLRFATVRDRTGLSRSTVWRLERRGDFPKHRRISPNTVAWVEQEIEAWMMSKVKAS